MGLITIQFGQCGNQIGHALFKYLINDITEKSNSINTDYINSTRDIWFSESKNSRYTPRSVLVDTENKVVSSLINNNDSIKYNNIIAKTEGGSANNWSYGYTLKAEKLVDEVIESVRKEVEKTNSVTHILSFLGSGGGTGSGTGSRVLETLRTEYPNKTILNTIVLPYKKGEIVTQNYNTILTLAKLHDITDGNIILENDALHKICSSLLSIKNVDINNMNNIVAHKISSIFQPAIDYSLHDFVSILTSHPSFKFVQIKNTPYIAREHLKFEAVPSWSTLIGHMRKMLRFLTFESPALHCCKSVGSLAMSRGGLAPEITDMKPLFDKELYPTWICEDDRIKYFHQPRKLYETERSLTLAINNNSIVNIFDEITEQAWNLFKHKAYLHQYFKYGFGETDFEAAFEKMESILNNYKEL